MIKVIRNSINIEGEWFVFLAFGTTEIKLKIRPLIVDIGKFLEGPHKTTKSSKFHNSKIIKKTTTDFKTFGIDLTDYLLEGFQGVGSAPDKHFEITAETKMKVHAIQGASDFIWEKAVELATQRIKEVIEFNDCEEKLSNAG